MPALEIFLQPFSFRPRNTKICTLRIIFGDFKAFSQYKLNPCLESQTSASIEKYVFPLHSFED
jgi:hypothetical protein